MTLLDEQTFNRQYPSLEHWHGESLTQSFVEANLLDKEFVSKVIEEKCYLLGREMGPRMKEIIFEALKL